MYEDKIKLLDMLESYEKLLKLKIEACASGRRDEIQNTINPNMDELAKKIDSAISRMVIKPTMDIEEIKAEYKVMMKVLRQARYLMPAEYEAIKAATHTRRAELCEMLKKEVPF